MSPEEILGSLERRSDCKRLGKLLDHDAALKQQVLDRTDLPAEAVDWDGKRILRWARDASSSAQERSNPIRRDEAFTCVGCGAHVPPHGRSARDHCPFCLVGLHVDGTVPGDRASTCGGQLQPLRVVQEGGRWILEYRCDACGAQRRNQVLRDGSPPDDWARVVGLASR